MRLFVTLFISLLFILPPSYAQKRPYPDWLSHAVFYQIYPQTFKDSNADGVGDLQGIISSLDYLQGLGINAIWLCPIYESPFCDAGYDVADYYKVAPRYGTNEEAEQLFSEAHKRGIKVIMDFVVGHTSEEHPWFKASARKEGKYKNWYIWTDDNWRIPAEYKGQFIVGYGPRNGAFMTNYFFCQPKLNFGFPAEELKYDWQLPVDHPDVVALKSEMKNILKFWLDKGADGFRVDMASSAGKDFWTDVRQWFDQSHPQALLISEWGEPQEAIASGFHADFMHWFRGYEDLYHKPWFHQNDTSQHSFFEAAGKGNITTFLQAFEEQYNAIDGQGFISIPVDNHDMVRVRNYGRSEQDLAVIYAFQFTFPNIPFVYYGDEIGMFQQPFDDLLAVEGAFKTRSGNRTPMQWNASANWGFSSAEKSSLYLPVPDDPASPTVEEAMKRKGSLYEVVKRLTELKKSEQALGLEADYEILYAKTDAYPLIYTRTMGQEQILVVLNPSAEEVEVTVPVNGKRKWKALMGSGVKMNFDRGATAINCKGQSFQIFKSRLRPKFIL